MKAVILAGGKGERLGQKTRNLPKPMVEVAGRPLLDYLLHLLQRYGISEAILLTGYLGDVIEDHFGDGSEIGLKLSYVREAQPLGTSGALAQLEGQLDENFLLLYGDVFADLKLDRLIDFHRQLQAQATLVAHPSDHPHDSDLLDADEEGNLQRIICKPHSGLECGNLGNAAMYVLSPDVFKFIPRGRPSDFMRDVFPEMLAAGCSLAAYRTAEYLKDMGTPERLVRVENDILAGKPERFNLEQKRPAIFFDRDGTLVEYVELLNKVEQLQIFPGAGEALQRVNRSDYLAFLVTNQPVVARNLCSFSELKEIHNCLEQQLGEGGGYLERIYFCPHHPDGGYPEEVRELKIKCHCRKPQLGMIEAAVDEYNVDLQRSWFVGDTSTDVQTGKSAGMKTVLVKTGLAGNDNKYPVVADFACADVVAAVDLILQQTENGGER
jgi:histidinol-phosphate phosphatase family protein